MQVQAVWLGLLWLIASRPLWSRGYDCLVSTTPQQTAALIFLQTLPDITCSKGGECSCFSIMLCRVCAVWRCWPHADAEDDPGKSGAAVKGGLGNSSKAKGKPGAKSTKAPLTGFAAFRRKLCKQLFGWMDPKYVALCSHSFSCSPLTQAWLLLHRLMQVFALVTSDCTLDVQVQAQWEAPSTINSGYLEDHGECQSGELFGYRQIANLMQVQ